MGFLTDYLFTDGAAPHGTPTRPSDVTPLVSVMTPGGQFLPGNISTPVANSGDGNRAAHPQTPKEIRKFLGSNRNGGGQWVYIYIWVLWLSQSSEFRPSKLPSGRYRIKKGRVTWGNDSFLRNMILMLLQQSKLNIAVFPLNTSNDHTITYHSPTTGLSSVTLLGYVIDTWYLELYMRWSQCHSPTRHFWVFSNIKGAFSFFSLNKK